MGLLEVIEYHDPSGNEICHKLPEHGSAETRMGSGKGAPDHWVAVVKRGRILFETAGISEELAKEAMRLASHKLPIGTRFVIKDTGTRS